MAGYGPTGDPLDTTKTDADVVLTETAAAAFHQIIEQKEYENAALKVGVAPGGCGGWEYQLGIAQRPSETDIVGESLGVTLYLDTPTLPLYNGCVIDFKDGLMGAGFSVTNPKAEASCSCGQSFKVTGEEGEIEEGSCSSAVAGNS